MFDWIGVDHLNVSVVVDWVGELELLMNEIDEEFKELESVFLGVPTEAFIDLAEGPDQFDGVNDLWVTKA